MTAPKIRSSRAATAVRSEETAAYATATSLAAAPGMTAREADEVIGTALAILRSRLNKPGAALESPYAVRDYLRLTLAAETSEKFGCLFLDSKHRVLSLDLLFQGTIDAAAVYPREIVKAALRHNAAAMILVHNHPSGSVKPSAADRHLTSRIKEAVGHIDVRVLDHFIIGGCADMEIYSFAEKGEL